MSASAPGPPGLSRGSSPELQRRGQAEELLRTEGRYLEQLEGVATYFVVTLKAKGILNPDVHEILFGPWESICSASRTLLFHLARGHFALGLESFCHQLVFYIHYAENLEAAQNILKKLVRKNKAFSRFKKLQESRPELKGCRLEELLPLPLQRLRQYRHLLQDLVEQTPPESTGFDQLQGALKSVLEVLHRVHEIARVRQNLEEMRQIQKQLKGRKTQVLAPGRWFLQEGWLMEVPSKGKEMQRRRCFLFSDILLLAKPCHPLHPWNSHKFACQAVYPLSHCVVEKVFGHTQSQGGLLSLSFPQKKLLLMSCDQEDFAKWHQNLVVAIRSFRSVAAHWPRRPSEPAGLCSKPPVRPGSCVWQPANLQTSVLPSFGPLTPCMTLTRLYPWFSSLFLPSREAECEERPIPSPWRLLPPEECHLLSLETGSPCPGIACSATLM